MKANGCGLPYFDIMSADVIAPLILMFCDLKDIQLLTKLTVECMHATPARTPSPLARHSVSHAASSRTQALRVRYLILYAAPCLLVYATLSRTHLPPREGAACEREWRARMAYAKVLRGGARERRRA